MNLVTLTSRATTAVVAGVAGFSSYRHIVEVAQRAGEHAAVAAVLPLSIDGLIVVGTMAMVEDKRAGRRPRLSARVALGVGVVATLAANIASAQPHLSARLVAAVPAIAFLITVEVLARAGRQSVAMSETSERPVDAVDPPALPPSADAKSDADQADKLSGSKPPSRKAHASARDRVERAHKRTPAATHKELADRLELSVRTVERWRPTKPAEPASMNGREPEFASTSEET